jgi:DNA adenine methylase
MPKLNAQQLTQNFTIFGNKQTEIVNVAKVKQLSPFRYPGGKTWLVPFFLEWLQSLSYKPKYLVEPFAGGGIISLSAAYYRLIDKCIMVEKDEDVASVWKTILYGDWRWLADQIQSINLTTENVKEIINAPVNKCEEMAFRTIVRNRVYHGGIMANGAGLLKYGENGKGILSRWYPDTLAKRIETIVSIKERLEFFEGDAFDYIPRYKDDEKACFFVDPPYTASKKKAGRRLYRYSEIDHELLFSMLKGIKGKFMLTYDCDETVISLAEKYDFNCREMPMTGTHNSIRRELIISNVSL